MAAAFNAVRFRVKPGQEQAFLDAHRKMDFDFPGLKRAAIVKTGDRKYLFVGEWDSFQSIVGARDKMVAALDQFRNQLEDLGGGLGVTDPVSGEVVVDLR